MRLPHYLLESRYFVLSSLSELLGAVEGIIKDPEADEINRLDKIGLPPIISREILGVMLGLNSGIIWSFQFRTARHYRVFGIKNGPKTRIIQSPKVGLKVFQKWFSVQIQVRSKFPDHVFGFIPGRSHFDAAAVHCGSNWVYSVDISNFFQTTPQKLVVDALFDLGYSKNSSELIAALCCLKGFLAQGSPSSPLLSNMVFSPMDIQLKQISDDYRISLTRYADDIVFSGKEEFPEDLPKRIVEIFTHSAWRLSTQKTSLSFAPRRLKVHGLLVHGEIPRLTKGYRNRIRAFEHLLHKDLVKKEDKLKIRGHIELKNQIKRRFSGK